MSVRFTAVFLLVALSDAAWFVVAGIGSGAPFAKGYRIGVAVRLGVHADPVSGTRIDLAEELRDTERGLLLVWMAHTCPTSNHLLPEMRRLHDDYAPRGWRVFGIYSNTGRGLSVPAEAWSERTGASGSPFPFSMTVRRPTCDRWASR